MADFLPNDYEPPAGNEGYMKLEQGDNRFRILSSAIVGYEWWVTDEDGNDKPKRSRPDETIPMAEIEREGDPKHFWAFVVYNYEKEKVQILQITQRTIQKSMTQYIRDDDWGKEVPFEYDLVINREGEGLDTSYSVVAKPKKEIDTDILKQYDQMDINLEALYDGEDPFAGHDVTMEDIEKAEKEDMEKDVDNIIKTE